MAITGSYGYTNVTESTVDLTPVAVGLSNYAVTQDDPGKCSMKNVTSPIDQVETISFFCQEIGKITQEEENVHPAPEGEEHNRMITARLEAKKRLSSSVDDTFCIDQPISTNVSWRFPKSQYITSQDLIVQLKRLIGALQDQSDDGYIIDMLMMQQLNPKNG
jgi:hypothetical protein